VNASLLAALILGVAIIIAAAVFAGRYTMSGRSSNSSAVFILDRFTGEVRRCNVLECTTLPAASDSSPQRNSN